MYSLMATGTYPKGGSEYFNMAADNDSARRRRVETVLSDAHLGRVTFDTLVNQVYEREYTGETDPVSHRRRVANALYYVHLPQLDELGIIDYDSVGGHVVMSSAR